MILKLKFSKQLSYAQTLGELLAARASEEWYQHTPLPDVLIPMPLHMQRLGERGFNQAIEIARPLATALGIPLDLDGLEREKATTAQSGLKAVERKKNMQRAFVATRDYSGLNIAVLDDVVTTGSTIDAACRALKTKGAKRIDIWAVARRG